MTTIDQHTGTDIGTDTGVRTWGQLIDGEWVPAASGRTVASRNPFDDSVFAHVAAGAREDARRAVQSAARAQAGWAALAPAAKQALFLKAADILEQRTPEIVRQLALETGAGAGFSYFQLSWSVNLLRLGAGWVYRPKGEVLQSDFPTTHTIAERRPLGVVASFTPWNGAHVLAWRAVVAPLAAGNTVVVKPSEEAPVTAGLLIGEILLEAGFPPGVVNVVTHAGPDAADVADEFYDNPAVRCLYFTGSAQVARRVASQGAATLTRSVLELGGYNQMIVLNDVDLDYAARTTAFSAFFHQGQICMNARRVHVHRDIYDDFVARVVEIAGSLTIGDPADPTTVIGPLITDKAAAGAQQAVESATAAGARVLTGGTLDGRLFAPTVLTDVPQDHPMSSEETFGPILIVRPFDDIDETIDLVNESRYGLTFSVLTENIGLGTSIASRIESGAVHVNTPTVEDEPHLPNGGTKDSGWGRSGVDALDDFSEVRWMSVESGRRPLYI